MRFLSLFSGIEAASMAWLPLGWTAVAFAEIDAFPCAALAQRYPDVPNLGDVSAITNEQIAALGPIDVVIGGSPCQDLSVAGKRAGLEGSRSSLFHEQVRIFHAAKLFCGARWCVWENVPGAYSSNRGRDFAVVVGTLAGCRLEVPREGWGCEGVALGENGLVEWSMLDAQWFGLAQRRDRVFAVLDTGNWRDRPPVLLEPESLRGDHPPRRESRERVAPAIAARTRVGGGLGTDAELDGALIADVAPTLNAGGNATGGDRPPGATVDTAESLVCMSSGQANAEVSREVATTLTTLHEAPIIAHALRADGFDASEDGTGRGTPLIPEPYTLAIRGRGDSHDLEYRQDGVANAILTPNGGRAGIGVGAVAFAQNQRDEVRTMEVAGALAGDAGMKQQTYIAFGAQNSARQGASASASASVTPTLDKSKVPGIGYGMQVRRLTPRECERLQGFPDDFTLIDRKGKPAADGPRYKALGNSMAVPVIRWIGRQIQRAHDWK